MSEESKKIEEQEEIDSATVELERYKALDNLSRSKGGKLMIEMIKKDISDLVSKLSYKFDSMTDIELRSVCASISPRITVLRAFQNAEANFEVTKADLEELLEKQNKNKE